MIKIPITEKMLLEWLQNTDLDDKPYPKNIRILIDEYNRLLSNVKNAMQKYPNYQSPEMYKISVKLNRLGIFPGGTCTEDGPTGEDYKFLPSARRQYESDSKFKAKVDSLIDQYEIASKEYWNEYLSVVEPPSIEFNKFHNAHWRELKRAGVFPIWPTKDIHPINTIPSINLA